MGEALVEVEHESFGEQLGWGMVGLGLGFWERVICGGGGDGLVVDNSGIVVDGIVDTMVDGAGQ